MKKVGRLNPFVAILSLIMCYTVGGVVGKLQAVISHTVTQIVYEHIRFLKLVSF